MISIVIPAHNEAAVIEACLRRLTDSAEVDEFEILVVCNGSVDDTAEVARSFRSDIRVIETEVASKSHALNLGDDTATGFPRFFVDADVLVGSEDIRRVARVLERGDVLAAAPRLEVDLRDRGWPIRAYFAIWMRLPYVADAMLGSGVYAVSEAGRARFDRFPSIIADDEFIRNCFEAHEKASVPDATFTLVPPASIRSLVHVEIRRRRGLKQLHEHEGTSQRDAQYWRQRARLLAFCLNPARWPAIAVYVWVKLATRVAYPRQVRGERRDEWRRDESSRSR